jgi:hypothetical protein
MMHIRNKQTKKRAGSGSGTVQYLHINSTHSFVVPGTYYALRSSTHHCHQEERGGEEEYGVEARNVRADESECTTTSLATLLTIY